MFSFFKKNSRRQASSAESNLKCLLNEMVREAGHLFPENAAGEGPNLSIEETAGQLVGFLVRESCIIDPVLAFRQAEYTPQGPRVAVASGAAALCILGGVQHALKKEGLDFEKGTMQGVVLSSLYSDPLQEDTTFYARKTFDMVFGLYRSLNEEDDEKGREIVSAFIALGISLCTVSTEEFTELRRNFAVIHKAYQTAVE